MAVDAEAEPVAVVLGGGGARGAYEAGALSVLLPVLAERGERPRIVLGTSAGALNASFLAANIDRPVDEVARVALTTWESMRWRDVVRRLLSGATLLRAGEYAGEVLGLRGARLESLLDPTPLRATVRERIDFGALERNVATGELTAVGVATTSAATGRSVVFHRGGPVLAPDDRRGIDYVETRLFEEHVLASAAIPVVFPAVKVAHPRAARGWYLDGGTRLNTPVKPALALGARRVVVVAVTPSNARAASAGTPHRPDALVAAGQILVGLLEDQLAGDIDTLATVNRLVGGRGRARRAGKSVIPYILITPDEPDSIGVRALRVVREHYGGALDALRSDVALLARLTAAETDARHAALLSFLLFAPEFARALIELGQADAERWLAAAHDLDDLWQIAPVSR